MELGFGSEICSLKMDFRENIWSYFYLLLTSQAGFGAILAITYLVVRGLMVTYKSH